MLSIASFYRAAIDLLATPEVRTISLLVSAASFIISLLAYRRTSAVMLAHQRNLLAEQSRFLDDQWQRLNIMFMTHRDAADWAEHKYPSVYRGDVRGVSFQYWLVNLLFSAYNSWRNGVIEERVFDLHLSSVHAYWNRDSDAMIAFMRHSFADQGFADDCQGRLERLPVPPQAPAPSTPAEPENAAPAGQPLMPEPARP